MFLASRKCMKWQLKMHTYTCQIPWLTLRDWVFVEKELVKKSFINSIVDELIDKKKLEEDIEEWVTNGELIHGYAEPIEMIEDDEGPIGFRVDRKKYLKASIINELKSTWK